VSSGRRKRPAPEQKRRAFVGTAGFQYPHWRGNFYPKGLRVAEEFERYAREFNAVELNTTFYGTPPNETFDAWRDRAASAGAGGDFVYCVKANQFFTHRKQLKVDDVFRSRWRDAWARYLRLGDHLGCVLFQFAPRFRLTKPGACTPTGPRPTLQRLMDLGEILPKEGRFAFEFRHPSWFSDPDVEAVFRRFNWCLCLVECCNADGWAGELPSGSNPPAAAYPVTCDWGVYFRFHGASGQYVGSYGPAAMRQWAKHLRRTTAGSSRVAYAFFNNTDDGEPVASAVIDARALRDALS